MGGGFESPRGTDNPVVEDLPQGDENDGGTLEGDRVPGGDRMGRVGDRNSPATRNTKGSTNTSGREEM